MVLRVDTEKGYIDLSKRRVSPEDAAACDEKYNKSKLVHTITRHAAETTNTDLEDLYKAFTWPLYKKHGHANDAFKNMVTSPEEMFDQAIEISGEEGAAVLTPEVRSAIVKDIKRRMTPTPLKIRADIELTCFHYDGVLHIRVSPVDSAREHRAVCASRTKRKCDDDDKTHFCTSVRRQNLLMFMFSYNGSLSESSLACDFLNLNPRPPSSGGGFALLRRMTKALTRHFFSFATHRRMLSERVKPSPRRTAR